MPMSCSSGDFASITSARISSTSDPISVSKIKGPIIFSLFLISAADANRRAIESLLLSLPPCTGLLFFRRIRKMIFKKSGPDVPRRGIGKRIDLQQADNRWRTLEQSPQEIHKQWFPPDI